MERSSSLPDDLFPILESQHGLTQIPKMENDGFTFATYGLTPECFNSKISPGLEYRLVPTRPMVLRRFGSIFPSAQTSSFM